MRARQKIGLNAFGPCVYVFYVDVLSVFDTAAVAAGIALPLVTVAVVFLLLLLFVAVFCCH